MDTLLGAVLFASLSVTALPPAVCDIVQTRTIERTFDSVEAAVVTLAGARLDASITDDREWVGGVTRDRDGVFRISEGAGCPGQDTVTFAVPLRRGEELVAFWHTHGGHGPDRSYFSPHDAQVVAETGRDFYLMTPRGELKVLTADHVRVARRAYRGDSVATTVAEAVEA